MSDSLIVRASQAQDRRIGLAHGNKEGQGHRRATHHLDHIHRQLAQGRSHAR